MVRLSKFVVLSTTILMSVGCASLTTSNENNIRVETVDATGTEVKDATCSILKGAARTEFKTPAVIPVQKGSADLRIDCSKEGVADGKAVLTSRAGGATFGNILAGGIIGALVDQSTGKAYNYPEWIQIIMGKLLAFDRKEHENGKPNKATVLEANIAVAPSDKPTGAGATAATATPATSPVAPVTTQEPAAKSVTTATEPERK
jgi:hypothetical protein